MSAQGPHADNASAEQQQLLDEIRSRLDTAVEQWRLVKVIGVGASGAVYRGVDEAQRRVAVKVLHRKFLASQIVRQRFLREHDILGQLQHPNVLAMYSTGITALNEPYIIMELLDGLTIDKVMKRRERHFNFPEVYEIIAPVLDALRTCHAQGIIHRDLKPANIFLTRQRTIKLLDFGVARFHTDGVHLTRDGTALGTPAFMSPEQATGRLDALDARSDLFSVGATMHYLLSGQYLHLGRTADETFVKAASSPAPSLARRAPDLPTALVRLVDRAVAWDPDDRWQSAQDMLANLHQLAQQIIQGAPAQPETPPAITFDAPLPDHSIAPFLQQARHVPDFGAQPAPTTRPRVDAPLITPPAAAQAAPAAAPAPQQAPPDRPSQEASLLTELFRALERMLDAINHYGGAHTLAMQRGQEAFATAERTLRAQPQGLAWRVRPYAFESIEGDTCWEPQPPHDAIPYRLFIHGLHRFTLLPGLTRHAFDQLIALMRVDPGRQLAPEDDLASALWDLQLPGVDVQIVSALQLDGRADERARLADRQAARHLQLGREIAAQRQAERDRVQMLMALGKDALAQAEALMGRVSEGGDGALSAPLREEDLALLRRVHQRQRDGWLTRASHTLRAILSDAAREQDLALMLPACGALLARLASAGHPQDALQLLEQALSVTPPAQRDALLAPLYERDALRALLSHPHPVQATLIDALPAPLDEALIRLLPALLLRPNLQPTLARWLDARLRADGGISALNRLTLTTSADAACALIALAASRQAIALIHPLLAHPDPQVVWCAIDAIGPNPALGATLERLSWSEDAADRARALPALARALGADAPRALAARVEQPQFHALPREERRLVFALIAERDPAAAEQLASALASSHTISRLPGWMATRQIAVEHLARHARSDEAIKALDAATKLRPWNSRELQEAAQLALDQVHLRLNVDRRGGTP